MAAEENTAVTPAPAAAPPPPPEPPPESKRKKLIHACSRKEYVKVMTLINEGLSPNVDWRGLLPIRTAVLVGDIDMVALLRRAGANPWVEPRKTHINDKGEEEVIRLGSCAQMCAEEMAKDLANPLQNDAGQILRVLNDPDEALRRVKALQSRLEAEFAEERRTATRQMGMMLVVFAVGAAVMHYFGGDYDGGDTREL